MAVPISAFDYDLPPELIAQQAAPVRDHARLLRLDRAKGTCTDHRVDELPGLLRSDDLLVVNDTRVFPARLIGRRTPSGGRVECFLLERLDDSCWDVLVHPGQKLKEGARVVFGEGGSELRLEVLARKFHGRRTVRLEVPGGEDVEAVIDAVGQTPLPPYIKRSADANDRERYQTMFAKVRGSVAAPTAGLHFTPALMAALEANGIQWTQITLHVGHGTFAPIRCEWVEEHRVEAERFEITDSAAGLVNRALDDGRRVVAVGTTTTRVLETVASRGDGRLLAGGGETDLYIRTGHNFRVVGGLLTNFHLPESSLLVLVSAFAGRERILTAYREAVSRRYRFYSYGDAMLIV